MALRSRGVELAQRLLARHGGASVAVPGSRRMASGHALDPAQTPLQQQASRRRWTHSLGPPYRLRRHFAMVPASAGAWGATCDYTQQVNFHHVLSALAYSRLCRLCLLPLWCQSFSTAAAWAWNGHQDSAKGGKTSPSLPSLARDVQYIDKEEKYGAHNYHPLPVVLNRGEERRGWPHTKPAWLSLGVPPAVLALTRLPHAKPLSNARPVLPWCISPRC
jgi:hypothetical protein